MGHGYPKSSQSPQSVEPAMHSRLSMTAVYQLLGPFKEQCVIQTYLTGFKIILYIDDYGVYRCYIYIYKYIFYIYVIAIRRK